MSRPKNPFPTPRCHKGRAVVDVYDAGTRHTVTLGAWGSPDADREFARLLAERGLPAAHPVGTNPTVNELLLAFLTWADGYYRHADGTPTNEIVELNQSARPLRELYGHTPAVSFGPKALATVRQRMIDNGLCRTLINRRVERVRRAFRWAASEELIPVTVYEALRTVAGLRRGRSEVRESEPVGPVDAATVDATLPYLDAHLRTMVELQRHTAMRPGEVCALRLAEIDRTGQTWVYRPRQHKTAHHGKKRVIQFGPKARAVLTRFLVGRTTEADSLVFNPAQARAERFKAARERRKSKVPPSQQNRRKANPKRVPGNVYRVTAYGHAIRRAAEKAGVAHWHPNQLRHTAATTVRKAHGLEAVQVLLGHAKADVSQIYAERDEALAAEVAEQFG